jgi:hypothetical protein
VCVLPAGAVDDLIKLGCLPEVLAAECLDDCMSEIREAVAASPSGERSGRAPRGPGEEAFASH